ncbi:MAG: rod shape-determining protein MreC [Bacillota bacterium]|nr:rod shape-determining protein MreC [Bacillota bacterium]
MTAWTRHRHTLLGVLAVVVLVAMAGLTAYFREDISAVERRVLEALSPVQRAATETGRSIRAFWVSLGELRHLHEENSHLRAQVEELLGKAPRLDDLEQENARLRAMLAFAPPAEFEALAARVIGRSMSNWFSTVEIDKGSTDGVTVNTVVVTQRGLVGRVVRVTGRTATVLLLTDPQSGVGAVVIRSREPGVVLGTTSFEDTCAMRLFSRDADVVRGDAVLTSGLGDVFPSGLHIGQVVETSRSDQGLLVTATVSPAVDFGRLEEVFVLCPRGG